MKNIKDITLSIFAIIGFVAILSSFNNQTQQETHGTPESHVWEMNLNNPSAQGGQPIAFAINKVTGEVRKYNMSNLSIDKNGEMEGTQDNKYTVMVETK